MLSINPSEGWLSSAFSPMVLQTCNGHPASAESQAPLCSTLCGETLTISPQVQSLKVPLHVDVSHSSVILGPLVPLKLKFMWSPLPSTYCGKSGAFLGVSKDSQRTLDHLCLELEMASCHVSPPKAGAFSSSCMALPPSPLHLRGLPEYVSVCGRALPKAWEWLSWTTHNSGQNGKQDEI